MKWVFMLLLFAGTTASAQVDRKADLMQKLKKQEQMRKGDQATKSVFIPNKTPARLVTANSERMLVALPRSNMPCVVPNMRFFRAMPNASDTVILKYPIDTGIYVEKRKHKRQ